MKKILSLLIILVLAFPVGAYASEDFIALDPYPYSSHVLGDDLIVRGDTNQPYVTIGFYYPYENGYNGIAKLIVTVTAKEFRQGYTIKTDYLSRLWPEGLWRIKAQYGNISAEEMIPFTKDPLFDRQLRIAEYKDNTLTAVTSYLCRGIQKKDNTLIIPLSDGSLLRVFSWNNFAPADSGMVNLFMATYTDGYVTNIKAFSGELVDYGNHTSLIISPTDRVEFFYWDGNLKPIA